MKRKTAVIVLGLSFAVTLQAREFEKGMFRIVFDDDNNYLPSSIFWKPSDVEFTAGKKGLNHTFYAFEFGYNLFREENKEFCSDNPKYVNECDNLSVNPVEHGDYSGLRAGYESSLAKVNRSVMVHATEPRMRIVYEFETIREVVVHDPDYFGIQLRLADGFSEKTVADLRRADKTGLITASGIENPMFYLPFAHTGPAIFTNPEKNTHILIQGACEGDVPKPFTDGPMIIEPGLKQVFTIDIHAGSGDRSGFEKTMLAEVESAPEWRKPFLMVNTAKTLEAQKELEEARSLLLRAAGLDANYSEPMVAIAMLGHRNKLPGGVDAFTRAAYRRPYDYGMMMMTGLNTYGKTEADRRLHLYNRLICNEAAPFHILSYVRPAEMLEQQGMISLACAMYRQALWAVDHTPAGEEEKTRWRGMCKSRIEKLEKKMLDQTRIDLPPLIPVQPGEGAEYKPF